MVTKQKPQKIIPLTSRATAIIKLFAALAA